MVIDLCNNQNKEQIVRWIWNMKTIHPNFKKVLQPQLMAGSMLLVRGRKIIE